MSKRNSNPTIFSTKAIGYVDGETQLSKYLKVKDFTKSYTATIKGIDNRLPTSLLDNAKKIAEIYDKIYDHFNGNVFLSSGYRSVKLNSVVGGSSTSQHKIAQAIDVQGKNGVKNAEVLNWVKQNIIYGQLIHEFGTSIEPKWTHIGLGTKMEFLKIGIRFSKGLSLHLTDEGDI